MAQTHIYDHVYWYLNEVTARVVAKSGIPTDRYHIGKIVLQSFKDDPEFVAQIDGGTGKSETNGSLLKRSIQCAISMRNLGLKHGDVMVVMAPNHLDLAVPVYAAMYLGVVIAPVDITLKAGELSHTFKVYKPSAIFCHSDKISEIQAALDEQDLKAIVTFDRHDDVLYFADLLKADDKEVEDFEAEDFDAEKSIATISPTSGSTGLPKGSVATYKTWTITGPHIWVPTKNRDAMRIRIAGTCHANFCDTISSGKALVHVTIPQQARFTKFPSPTRSWLILSPLQWLTAALHYMTAPFIKYTRIQTSTPVTLEHTRYLINTYRPMASVMTPSMVLHLLKSGDQGRCDMSCFDIILISGAAVDKDTVKLIKNAAPKTTIMNVFGMTELSTIAFQGECPVGSCGKPSGIYQHRLIDLETQKDVLEPHVNGELWIKGPMFEKYYNNPEATAEAFAEDRWFKTGDMFYRDENWNYYFVERIKLLLKYRSFQISPTEIEAVIREHPGVLDAAVTSIPDPECGDLPVACVIPKPECNPTAQEIKDLVKESLSDAKQLRGGVAFVSSFPLTSTTKINRRKLHEIVQHMKLD